MIAPIVLVFVNLFVPLFSGVLLVRILMSYILKPGNRFLEALMSLTEPLLGPIRKLFPPASGIDFAPLVALLLLQGFQTLINNLIQV
jgi:YggT family protein